MAYGSWRIVFYGSQAKVLYLKRWRYAQARTIIQQDEPFMEMAAGLYAAGDAFLHADDLAGKARMESAVLSGVAVAEALLK